MSLKNKGPVLAVNVILVIFEIAALVHDCAVFGTGLFQWYTIDSNVFQMCVSALVVYYCVKDMELPAPVTFLHFVSAVGLTVTFLIAAFVLAPEGGNSLLRMELPKEEWASEYKDLLPYTPV